MPSPNVETEVIAVPRSWLAVHVPAPFRLSPTVPDAVAQLRSADPGAQWSFERVGRGLTLWFHSTDDVLSTIARRLPGVTEAVSHPPAAVHVTGQDVGSATALSQLSSDFAMSVLRAGELSDDARRDTAVRHMAAVTRLLPAARRNGFLFQCWQHWTRNLTPFERVALSAAAGKTGLIDTTTVDWKNYLTGILEIVDGRLEASAYLLFHHAYLTHNRLGIDERTGALAALAVRKATTAPEPELQRV